MAQGEEYINQGENCAPIILNSGISKTRRYNNIRCQHGATRQDTKVTTHHMDKHYSATTLYSTDVHDTSQDKI